MARRDPLLRVAFYSSRGVKRSAKGLSHWRTFSATFPFNGPLSEPSLLLHSHNPNIAQRLTLNCTLTFITLLVSQAFDEELPPYDFSSPSYCTRFLLMIMHSFLLYHYVLCSISVVAYLLVSWEPCLRQLSSSSEGGRDMRNAALAF